MENQHRQIKGYRELSQAEIDLMNEIKEKGAEFEVLIKKLHDNQTAITEQHGTPDGEARRWISIGKTHLQQGLMALTRAVAKPEFF
jgi:hypothetical protein